MRQTLTAIWLRLRALALRKRLERDLDEELAFHLAMREADYRASGMDPASARLAARRRVGNPVSLKERMRDMWVFPTFESIMQDVRNALRTLRRSPGFTFVAVVALAIGIGGNTAIFSLVDGVRTRALPFHDPDRLVILWGNVMRTTLERRGGSYPDFIDWRTQSRSFDSMAAFDGLSITITTKEEARRIRGEFVSAPYFSLLGVRAAQGRTFLPEEDVGPQKIAVAIISDGLWTRTFGRAPEVVGQNIQLSGRSYEVVGVTPPGFRGLNDDAEV